jgi:hypothetical protein
MEEEHVKGDGVAKSPPNAFFPTSIYHMHAFAPEKPQGLVAGAIL